MAYGGHLARETEWGFNNGASEFPGASGKAYASLDGASDKNVNINPSAIVRRADLSISKTDAPDPVTAGETLTYSIRVDNLGPNRANGVSVSDNIPSQLTGASGTWTKTSPSGSGTCTGTAPMTCAIGDLDAGASATVTITATVAPSTTDGTVITNMATVSQTGPGDPVSGNNSATTTTTVRARASLSINDVSKTEGNAGTSNFDFTVTLSPASSQTVTVAYATTDGTATGGSSCAGFPTDYETTAGSLSFAPGETQKTITVRVCGDTVNEPDETFFVNLSGATNATISDGQGRGTIVNDEAAPALSINDVSKAEGNAGTTNFDFTVTLSPASSQSVTVDFATIADTATEGTACGGGTDYLKTTGSLTFAPGVTQRTITVPVCGDSVNEANETFFVNLSNPSGATISDGQGTGTIENDDAAPTLSIGDDIVSEGEGPPPTAVFQVTLSSPSGQTVTVAYATADGSAEGGTCAGGKDYVSESGTVTFLPGDTSEQIDVVVCDDAVDEAAEAFFVNLSAPTNATIGDGQGEGTITDDDAAPTLSIDDVSKAEGNLGVTTFTFTVTKTGATALPATVQFTTEPGSATEGTCPTADYVDSTGSRIFLPGETTKTIDVVVCGDTTFENDETFTVELSAPTNATISDGTGLGTIRNDDTAPTLSIDDVSANEGNVGTTPFTFTVTKTGATALAARVDFATADGTAAGGAACAPGTDYISQSGTLTFAPGTTTLPITVLVCGDNVLEPDETFFVNLSNPTNATITDGQGRGTIQNDDDAATLSLDPAAATNPVDSQHCVTATARNLAGTPVQGVTVIFSVAGSVSAGGSAVTGANGEAKFCYTGPPLPGADAITAFADNNDDGNYDPPGEPTSAATKTWTFPASTPLCEVIITQGGWIIASNTDRASFGGNAHADGEGNASGVEEYQDHGPMDPMNVHGNVRAVLCNGTRATIFGEATIDGQGMHAYRIEVQDLAEPGVGSDTYRMRILRTTGLYDSGEQTLRGGNVQIHQG
ncbi:MAG: Calx-beta domain-containing protein [Actinomycetota bacterium]